MKLKSISFSPEESDQIQLIDELLTIYNVECFPFIYYNQSGVKEAINIYAINSNNSFIIYHHDVKHSYAYGSEINKCYVIVNMPIEKFMILFNKYKKLKVFI
jgi:hypothetical protein